jgi:primosomal protein N' (replication factor Y)
MIYVEVVVNAPIRRTFARRYATPPPPEDAGGELSADADAGQSRVQTFHYHLPPELETTVQAGSLVWVPFGHREVQGVVARRTASAPVTTKPVMRLARPEPVLTPAQLGLAAWIADYYVATLSEAVKLFLPPGLLTKDPDATGVRAKRELEIELLADAGEIERRLPTLGRSSQRACALELLMDSAGQSISLETLRTRCKMKSNSAIDALVQAGLVEKDAAGVTLAVEPAAARTALIEMRGSGKYLPALEALQAAGRPLWKSELYARADADLKILRELERAGLVALTEKVHFRDPLAGRTYPRTKPPLLTSEQVAVWTRIEAALDERVTSGAMDETSNAPSIGASAVDRKFLLHGVTGSGKTEIYLRAIERTLAQGRQAIVLVPEIALTPQTVARFAGRFPGRVTVIHSELSQGERYDVWRLIRAGQYDVVVGPRSALFAPLANLGLIVIDEEHESVYKQNAEEWGGFTVFYDARTVADRLAELTGSALIMGSATPSLEAYRRAEAGEIALLEMPRRVMGHRVLVEGDEEHVVAVYAEMPPVEVVDMRQELRAGNRSIFSRSLQGELHAVLDAGEQAILFMNRRGAATFVMCRDCGHVEECPHCATPLTYHARVNMLVCHRCNRRYPIPEVCPECGSKRIKYFGVGTQRVEEFVHQIAPRARVLRWDADVTGSKGSHERILHSFTAHEADVLIGTQMIAKGLDLPLVTLVGVVAADVGLYLPDFRSSERTFQLLTQVAGRAGRSARGGRVVIQTYTPEHYAIQAAARHDYQAFYEREMVFRSEQGYPPVQRLARLIYWHKKLEKAKAETKRMAAALRYQLTQLGLEGDWIGVLGPAPAFFARYRDYYRWQIVVQAPDPARLVRRVDIPFGWRIDIDPVSLL